VSSEVAVEVIMEVVCTMPNVHEKWGGARPLSRSVSIKGIKRGEEHALYLLFSNPHM
jgi:hypothetical protein